MNNRKTPVSARLRSSRLAGAVGSALVPVVSRAIFPSYPMTIVSAADESHGNSLYNLVQSANKWEKNSRVIVYDLGLSQRQRQRILEELSCDVRVFKYESYPSFLDVRRNAGEYAWKATIVKEIADECGGMVCWMDAGNIIRYPLLRLRSLGKKNGYFAQMSDGTIRQWTHPGMLAFFNLPEDWKGDAINLNASGIIFDTDSKIGREIIGQWAEFSLIKECIAPTGSSRANHRQDQALLTVLAYRLGEVAIPRYRHPEFITHQDVG